jgi:mannosyltransferase OCH1-like enzyme
MIPKIIHQTWKSHDVPKEFIPFQERVRSLHPDWEYRLWTDEDNLAFVRDKTPHLYNTYISLPKNIMRADMIRYVIMSKIGGLYLDLDYEMLKPFDLLEFGLVLPYNRNISFGDMYDSFGNCIFASMPGHPFWEHALNDLCEERNYETFFSTLRDKPYVSEHTTLEEAITGPAFLTRIFYSFQDVLHDYILPSREIFHPPAPKNDGEYNEMIAKGISYGIHHCSGTWRKKSSLSRIKLKISRLFH